MQNLNDDEVPQTDPAEASDDDVRFDVGDQEEEIPYEARDPNPDDDEDNAQPISRDKSDSPTGEANNTQSDNNPSFDNNGFPQNLPPNMQQMMQMMMQNGMNPMMSKSHVPAIITWS